MKKTPALLATFAALCLVGSHAVAAHITFSAGYTGPWEWDEITMTVRTEGLSTYYKGTARITGYSGSATELEIPSKIAWYHDVTADGGVVTHFEYEVDVVGIGEHAFDGSSYYSNHYLHNKALVSVAIPDSVTSIGNSAFDGCTSLGSIVIGSGVTSIGERAFAGCGSLSSVSIPNSVTSIGEMAFFVCTSLTSVTIGSGVTNIENYMFENCTSLKSVTIPNNVTNIGADAFGKCSGLESVTIGSGVKNMGVSAFNGCVSLGTITIPNNVTNIGERAFEKCSGLRSVTIGSGVTNIAKYMFSDCTSLMSVTIGNGVTSIGKFAFSECTSLESVTIPNSMMNIGGSAFYRCSSLESITIPNSVTNIENGAFYNCTGLSAVTILGNVKNDYCQEESSYSYGLEYPYYYYYWSPFSECQNIESITLGGSMTKIGNYMFYGLSNVKTVTIGSGVQSIGDRAFEGLSNVKTVTIGSGVQSIGEYAFGGCNPTDVHLSDIAAWCAIDFKDPSSYLFRQASNLYIGGQLVTSLVIPDGVKNIPPYAFHNCDCLQSVHIPESVTNIGESAFSDCDNITEVRVPQYVMTQGLATVFAGSYEKLRRIRLGANVTTIRDDEFDFFRALEQIEVEAGNGSFLVSGDGCLYDAGLTKLIVCPRINAGITIPNGVRAIGNYAFQYCTNLVSVFMPETIQSIGSYSFSSCPRLSGLTIPESVQSLATTAFDGCNVLWTEWYRALANLAANGGGAQSGGGGAAAAPDPRYALAAGVADRAIATVTVDGDSVIDSFVLTDGKVFDTVLRVINTSASPSTLTLPSGYAYERLRGTTPLTIPALSTNLLTITRTADRVFFVAREELEPAQ